MIPRAIVTRRCSICALSGKLRVGTEYVVLPRGRRSLWIEGVGKWWITTRDIPPDADCDRCGFPMDVTKVWFFVTRR